MARILGPGETAQPGDYITRVIERTEADGSKRILPPGVDADARTDEIRKVIVRP